ncbi:unnamed protein product [Brassica oleracea]
MAVLKRRVTSSINVNTSHLSQDRNNSSVLLPSTSIP